MTASKKCLKNVGRKNVGRKKKSQFFRSRKFSDLEKFSTSKVRSQKISPSKKFRPQKTFDLLCFSTYFFSPRNVCDPRCAWGEGGGRAGAREGRRASLRVLGQKSETSPKCLSAIFSASAGSLLLVCTRWDPLVCTRWGDSKYAMSGFCGFGTLPIGIWTLFKNRGATKKFLSRDITEGFC